MPVLANLFGTPRRVALGMGIETDAATGGDPSLLSDTAALGLMFDMLGAILLVHLAGGFFLPAGYEFALTLFATCLAIVLAGPGSLSVDAALGARRAGTGTV